MKKIRVRNMTNKGFIEVKVGGVLDLGRIESDTRRGRVIDEGDTSPTLQQDCAVGVVQVGQMYGTEAEPNPQAGRLYSQDGLSPTLDSMGGGNRMPKVIVAGGIGEKKSNGGQQFFQQDRVYDTEGISPALAENKADLNIIAQRGRGEGWQQQLEPRTDGLTNSLTSAQKDNMVQQGIRIRKLTPKECFRLQGFPDEYFDRAAEVCSDSQLYKQAGNSVTVNVIYEIAKRLKEIEE